MSYSYSFNCTDIIVDNTVEASSILFPNYDLSNLIKIGDRLSEINGTDSPIVTHIAGINDSLSAITFVDDISSYISINDTFTITDTEITTTTTTTYSNVVIGIDPYGQVVLNEHVTFYIATGASICDYASFKWYLDNQLVSTESTFTTIFDSLSEHTIYVEVTEYLDQSWLGGNFYGGTFRGSFNGGTFNYGNLNDCCIISQIYNPKIFTSKI